MALVQPAKYWIECDERLPGCAVESAGQWPDPDTAERRALIDGWLEEDGWWTCPDCWKVKETPKETEKDG